ncbi:MAG: hypothetical protein ACI4WH_08120 [Oscillospiraceae bacterium]
MKNQEDLKACFGLYAGQSLKKVLEELDNNQTDEQELEEFDYDETKNILFKKFKEMSQMKFHSEENYIECCKAMDNIAMTLLETE